jgi:hypothetical protein
MLHAQTSALVIEELLLTLQAVVLTTFFVARAGSSRGAPATAHNGPMSTFGCIECLHSGVSRLGCIGVWTLLRGRSDVCFHIAPASAARCIWDVKRYLRRTETERRSLSLRSRQLNSLSRQPEYWFRLRAVDRERLCADQ